MMTDSPYRTAVEPEDLSSMRSIEPIRGAKLLARIMMGSLVAFFIALLTVPWVQTSAGNGAVIAYAPLERRQNIEAPIEGRLIAWYVQEGAHVTEGQKIAELSDNDPEILARLRTERDAAARRIEAAQSRIESLQSRITSLEALKNSSQKVAEARIRMADNRAVAAEKSVTAAQALNKATRLQWDRQKELQSMGISSTRTLEVAEMENARSEMDVLRAQASLDQARNDAQAMRSELLRILDERDTAIEDAKASKASAESELASASASLQQVEVRLARQQNMVITAPRDGTILRLMVNQGTEMVRTGESIASFVPDTAQQAVEIFVDGNDIPLVTQGRKARIQFEGWPAVQFSGWPSVAVGTFAGTVALVDATDNGKGKFRVVIVPDGSEKWPENRYLRQGVRAFAWIQLNQVTAGYELWRQFNGFPPAIPEEPSKNEGGVKLRSK